MAADEDNTPDARRAAPLAPLPDHRNVNTPWWQELWRRHAHLTRPLRERGLECDIEFGLSAYIVRVSLPDDSYLIIGPPQEPSSEHPPGDPEGWIVTRERISDRSSLFERIYDSAPPAYPGGPKQPEARHAGSVQPLIEAIDQRLTQLGLLTVPPHLPEADADAPSHLRGLAERIHRAADDIPLTGTAHPVTDNLDELEDRVRDVTDLIVNVTGAAAIAHREAGSRTDAQADAVQRQVTALTHTVGALGRAFAHLGQAVAHAGHLHHDAALPRSPERAGTRAATRSVLDDQLNAARRQLHEAGRRLRLDSEQLTSRPTIWARAAAPVAPRPTAPAASSTRTR